MSAVRHAAPYYIYNVLCMYIYTIDIVLVSYYVYMWGVVVVLLPSPLHIYIYIDVYITNGALLCFLLLLVLLGRLLLVRLYKGNRMILIEFLYSIWQGIVYLVLLQLLLDLVTIGTLLFV